MLLEREVNPDRADLSMAGHRSGGPLVAGIMGSKGFSKTEVSAPPY